MMHRHDMGMAGPRHEYGKKIDFTHKTKLPDPTKYINVAYFEQSKHHRS